MPKQFKGEIKLDVRESTPDWDAFLAGRAPQGAPNVLVVLYDDTGCAAWSAGSSTTWRGRGSWTTRSCSTAPTTAPPVRAAPTGR
jgi:hypothetical protein